MIKQFLTGIFAILTVSGTLTTNSNTTTGSTAGNSILLSTFQKIGNSVGNENVEVKTGGEYELSVDENGEIRLFIPETSPLRTDNNLLSIRINTGVTLADAELTKNEEIESYIIDYTVNKEDGLIHIYLKNVPQLFNNRESVIVGNIKATKSGETEETEVDFNNCTSSVISEENSMNAITEALKSKTEQTQKDIVKSTENVGNSSANFRTRETQNEDGELEKQTVSVSVDNTGMQTIQTVTEKKDGSKETIIEVKPAGVSGAEADDLSSKTVIKTNSDGSSSTVKEEKVNGTVSVTSFETDSNGEVTSSHYSETDSKGNVKEVDNVAIGNDGSASLNSDGKPVTVTTTTTTTTTITTTTTTTTEEPTTTSTTEEPATTSTTEEPATTS
ncbi:MAG: hypothetical protein K2J08_08105, partial [Ruminococcus sp.]|nr:hypothetical protein [Ruminococcus sp.]